MAAALGAALACALRAPEPLPAATVGDLMAAAEGARGLAFPAPVDARWLPHDQVARVQVYLVTNIALALLITFWIRRSKSWMPKLITLNPSAFNSSSLDCVTICGSGKASMECS